ncbi:hypothetical protein B0H12DRAFT_388819 [Mycena haematopus]|nr:hypothetical protein B0H12DRAFT_388819 [Mycena haematopus]
MRICSTPRRSTLPCSLFRGARSTPSTNHGVNPERQYAEGPRPVSGCCFVGAGAQHRRQRADDQARTRGLKWGWAWGRKSSPPACTDRCEGKEGCGDGGETERGSTTWMELLLRWWQWMIGAIALCHRTIVARYRLRGRNHQRAWFWEELSRPSPPHGVYLISFLLSFLDLLRSSMCRSIPFPVDTFNPLLLPPLPFYSESHLHLP